MYWYVFFCSYLFDHQILFTNQCKPTCNYFDNIEQLIILLALLDPIIYAIFVYLLPEHSKKVHNKNKYNIKKNIAYLPIVSLDWYNSFYIIFLCILCLSYFRDICRICISISISHFKFLLFSGQSFISNIKTPLSRDVFVILIQLLLFCNHHTR